MTNEMIAQLSDTVKSYMEVGDSFSYYDIFRETRDEFDWNIRYSDVRNEVRDAVKNAVAEIGGYESSFYNDEDAGKVYLLFSPIEDCDEEDEDNFDDDDDFDRDQAADYDQNGNEDYDDDCENCNCDVCKNTITRTLSIDTRKRVYLTKELVKFSGYTKDYIYINYFKPDNVIILSEYEDADADCSKRVKFDKTGMHVLVNQLIGNITVKRNIFVTAKAHSDTHTISLTA